MPPEHTSRRGFIGMAGRTAAAVTAAGALPVICAGPAHAAAEDEPSFVLSHDHPDAIIPHVSDADYAAGVSREPLNATCDCALPGGEGA
ncbi:twin-arginine translocation signal domain-containing protein [Streptomyces ziwulingensis]